jgi:hypothetical protein
MVCFTIRVIDENDCTVRRPAYTSNTINPLTDWPIQLDGHHLSPLPRANSSLRPYRQKPLRTGSLLSILEIVHLRLHGINVFLPFGVAFFLVNGAACVLFLFIIFVGIAMDCLNHADLHLDMKDATAGQLLVHHRGKRRNGTGTQTRIERERQENRGKSTRFWTRQRRQSRRTRCRQRRVRVNRMLENSSSISVICTFPT